MDLSFCKLKKLTKHGFIYLFCKLKKAQKREKGRSSIV
eukprot:UN00955